MNTNQFEVISKLIRARESTKIAAKLVLIDGFRISETSRKTELSPQSVFNTVQRYRYADKLIKDAYSSCQN